MSYGCKGNLPHKYETVAEDKTIICEVCILCNNKKVYNKVELGRIDSKEYMKEHARDFVQPNGKTGKLFEQLYGKPQDMRKKGTSADFNEV